MEKPQAQNLTYDYKKLDEYFNNFIEPQRLNELFRIQGDMKKGGES